MTDLCLCIYHGVSTVSSLISFFTWAKGKDGKPGATHISLLNRKTMLEYHSWHVKWTDPETGIVKPNGIQGDFPFGVMHTPGTVVDVYRIKNITEEQAQGMITWFRGKERQRFCKKCGYTWHEPLVENDPFIQYISAVAIIPTEEYEKGTCQKCHSSKIKRCGYDFTGILGFVIRRQIERIYNYFCSEASRTSEIANAVRIINKEPWKTSPRDYEQAIDITLELVESVTIPCDRIVLGK